MKRKSLSIVLILCIWLGVSILINNQWILPTPFNVLKTMMQQLQSSNFMRQLGQTFFRILLAIIASWLLSLLIFVISHINRIVRDIITYLLEFIQVMPIAIFLMIFIIWFSSYSSTIIITMLVMVPLMIQSLWALSDNITILYKDPIELYGYTLKDVILPLISIPFLNMLKSASLLGIKVLVSSEVMVSIASGLGRQIQLARFDLDVQRLFSIGIWVYLFSLIITFVFDSLIKLLDNKLY